MSTVWVNDTSPALSGPNLNQWGQEIIAAAQIGYTAGTGIGVSYDGTSRTLTISNTYAETLATAPPGSLVVVRKDPTTGFWPSGYDASGQPIYTGGSATAAVRPTARADITCDWDGPDPSPTSVASGTGGPLQGVDRRTIPNA